MVIYLCGSALRHRRPADVGPAPPFPRTLLVISLLLWLPVVALIVAVGVHDREWFMVFAVTLPAIALGVTVGLRGLRRTPWWAWGVGIGWVVVMGGLFMPALAVAARELGWTVSVASFLYAQNYIGMLGVLDDLWIGRHARGQTIEDARMRLRRMLQVRLLVATLVASWGMMTAYQQGSPAGDGRFDPMLPLGPFYSCCCLPIVFAFWFRWRPLAWAVAGMIGVFFVVNLGASSPENMSRALLQYGWVVLVAVYLWTKAARVWYWPMGWPEPMPPPPSNYPFPWPVIDPPPPPPPPGWPGGPPRPGAPGWSPPR